MTTATLAGLVLIGGFVLLLLMRVPISFAMLLSTLGSALFVGCAIGKTPIERTAKNMMPLYVTMVIVLMLVTYIPDVSLLLPRLLMGYGA